MLTPPPAAPCSMDHQFSTAVGPVALTSAAMRHHLHCCPPLPSTQMHPVIQNSRGRSSKEAQLTSQLVTLAPKEGKAELVCPAAAAPPLERGKLAHHQSKSCSGRAGGAVHSEGRVSPCLCFCALCFFCFSAGLFSSHEHLWGCALDSNHKKNE